MTMYLQMDGVDDYIKPANNASFSYDTIELDCIIDGTAPVHQYVYDNPSNIYRINANSTNVFNSSMTGTGLAFGTRTTLVLMFTSGPRANIDAGIFAQRGGTLPTKGSIYAIRIYNGGTSGTLEAFYDMSTGTVLDQSGNGNDATLFGGTWLDDAAGGTAYTADLSDGLAPSDAISKRLTIAVADAVGTAESIDASGGKAVNVSDAVIITDAIRKALTLAKADAVITSEVESEATRRLLTDAIASSDSVIVTGGKAVLLTDAFALTDEQTKAIAQAAAESLGIADSIDRNAAVNVQLFDVVITDETFTRHIPDAPPYLQIIHYDVHLQRDIKFVVEIVRSLKFTVKI